MDNNGKKGLVLTRRDFAAAGGALSILSIGLGLSPRAWAKEIKFPQSSCGEEGKDKVLVAYASKYGTTGGVAEAIGKELCAAGLASDVKLAAEVTDLTPYKAVIVGGPARNFAWMTDATNFVKKNEDALAKVPVAYFLMSLQVVPTEPGISAKGKPPKDETPEQRKERVKEYLDPVIKNSKVKPVDLAVFAGALDFNDLNPTDRTIMKGLGFIDGDFRDFDAIKAWAREMAGKLIPAK